MKNRPSFKLHEDFNFENKKIGDLSRETVERESRFEINESGRQANELVREENELVRVSAESERVSNESERISKDGERDSKIDAVKDVVDDVSSKVDSKADVSELELYAKKEQEDWITPTLINGWEQHSDYAEVGYYKDDFGVVHLKGSVGQGESRAYIFILPAGYRPNKFTFYPVTTSPSGADIGSLYVNSGGGVYSYHTGDSLSLNHISFRAER